MRRGTPGHPFLRHLKSPIHEAKPMKTALVILSFIALAALLVKAGVGLRSVAKLIVGLPLILSAMTALAVLAAFAPTAIA
jgi:hypothetical protein